MLGDLTAFKGLCGQDSAAKKLGLDPTQLVQWQGRCHMREASSGLKTLTYCSGPKSPDNLGKVSSALFPVWSSSHTVISISDHSLK